MADHGYSVPHAEPVLRRDAFWLALISIGLCLGSLLLPWNNVVVSIQPTGPTTPPIVTQQAYYGATMPHGWILIWLMLWVGVFLYHLRKKGVAWLESPNGRISRMVLSVCLFGLAVLIIQTFIYGTSPCRVCPTSVIGWGTYFVLIGLSLAIGSLWRLRLL